MHISTPNSSWCEKLIVISLSLICIVVVVDWKLAILPFHGVFLIAYLALIIALTTWLTFTILRMLLVYEKPFEYDINKNKSLQLTSYLINMLSKVRPHYLNELEADDKTFHLKKRRNIDERIDDFVHDVELRFVLKWYMYISMDPTFPEECKTLLDEVVRKFLQVVVEVDGRRLVHDCIIVFLKHVKEFRRAIKKSLKSNNPIEELYRYSHIGSKSPKAMEQFIYCLTANILRQFINWELWNSLPCRSLVSILSRKFTTYLLVYFSSPGFLNYRIVQSCASETTKTELNLDKYYFISLSDVDHSGALKQADFATKTKKNIKNKKIEILKNKDSDTPKTSPNKIATKKEPTSDKPDSQKRSTIDRVQNGSSIVNDYLIDQQNVLNTNDDTQIIETQKIPGTSEKKSKASEPVKIYESKSANKTWRNSSDLECISLGQDLLAFQEFTDPDSQIQELIERKLWKDSSDPGDEEKSGSIWDISESWFAEEEATANGLEETAMPPATNFQNYLKSTANTAIGNVTASTIHNMKELQQTTVNTVNTVVKPVSQATSSAMHKIGDLQDEAAGMVEGILDFGIAGLRKGLRLTGLQDNFSELTQKAKSEFHKSDDKMDQNQLKSLIEMKSQIKVAEAEVKTSAPIKIAERDAKRYEDKSKVKLMKTPHVSSEEKFERIHSSSKSDESVWLNPLSKDSPSFEGHILLEKTPDSVPKSVASDIQPLNGADGSFDFAQKDILRDIPQITEEIIISSHSPDPEYEEPQDFASTIAKLRTLLQQKSSESGFTTPALSPMPQDDMVKTPSDPPPADILKVDGAMPSLYKFCARTATGVFQNTLNTIKTALPGNVNEPIPHIISSSLEDWTFIEADTTNEDFYSKMKKLLHERRVFCTVDTAFEAIDTLEVIDQTDSTWTIPTPQFDDELDEFDLKVPLTKALVDVVCEVISDSNTCLLREPVIKAVLLLIGNCSEEYLTKHCDSLLHNINKHVGKLPENTKQDVMSMQIDDVIKICLESFPFYFKSLLGKETIEAGVHLVINSLQSQQINQDVFVQMLELFASELINACSQVSPAYSA